MKVICDRDGLLNAVNTASGVVAARSPRPQLGCIRLTASKEGSAGELMLAATDAEIALTLRTSLVEVEEPGEALIPADKLRQIVSAEDADATLTIETQGDACHIRGADAHFKVFGYPTTEFPPIPTFASVVGGSGPESAKAVFSHAAGSLGEMITRTLFAAARESSRYAINGVLLKREGSKLEMVATDGRRLALCRASCPGGEGEPVQCIIPSKAMTMALRLIEDSGEPVRFAVTGNQVLMSFGAEDDDPEGRAVLVSNLVEGAFPPYEDVIPKEQDIKVTLDRDVFASAIRRAALLTNEESRGVRMKFVGADKRVELASRAPEVGEAEVNVDLAGYDGPQDIEIGFNPTFIHEALKVITEPQVIFELKSTGTDSPSSNKPGLMRAGTNFTYVVMPVNLQ